MKMRALLAGTAVLLLVFPLAAQQKTKVYVADIKGPDQFISERFKLLFMEELSNLKSVELVTAKDDAQVVLEGVGRLYTLQQSATLGTANESGAVISGRGGDAPNAVLSITLTERQTGRILFVGNKSRVGGGFSSKGATHDAVAGLVKDLKKKLNWK